MTPRYNWVVIPIALFFGSGITRAQERRVFSRNVQLQIERFMLHQGLPGGEWDRRLVSVGKSFGAGKTTVQDKSGKVLYVRVITGQSRWLPDNGIEVALNIDENGVKHTETIRLEDFQPKTILLRELPRNRREELRLIPEYLVPEVTLANSQ